MCENLCCEKVTKCVNEELVMNNEQGSQCIGHQQGRRGKLEKSDKIVLLNGID